MHFVHKSKKFIFDWNLKFDYFARPGVSGVEIEK